MAAWLTKWVLAGTCARSAVLLRSNIPQQIAVCQTRGKKVWLRRVLHSLYRRRLEQGPEPERPRSAFVNWNYDSEIYSFGKRLGEEFSEATLKIAFTNQSFIEEEKSRRSELQMDDIELLNNEELARRGQKLATEYIHSYLRAMFPALPEEGVLAITYHLMTEEMLAYIGSNLGIKDLILCAELPPSNETLSKTFKAVIGALDSEQGTERAQLFVQDFIVSELIGKELSELWNIVNPMGVLDGVLTKHSRGPPEPRLLYEGGSQTIEAAYAVGLYSDRQLVGKGYGETVTIAEEMAARDALRRIFGLGHRTLKLGRDGHKLKLDTESRNISIQEYTKHQLQNVQ